MSAVRAVVTGAAGRMGSMIIRIIHETEGIEVTGFEVPQVKFSDHLPLICDFNVA